MACGPAPEGHSRWTLRLLEEKARIELDTLAGKKAIRQTLKNEFRPHKNTYWLLFRLPPGYPHKKAARFFLPDGFLRNVIALIKFFRGCRLRKALILQYS